MARTLWLVGMMGAGKSSVGRILARRLGRRFVDTDAEIEAAAGGTIAEIFEREGEAGFRAREREAVRSHVGEEAVVALGGGALTSEEARAALVGAGTRVYLRAGVETLLERLGDCADRPLLRGLTPADRRERLRALLEERRAGYEAAEVIVDTDGVSEEDVAEAVARAVAGPGPGSGAPGERT